MRLLAPLILAAVAIGGFFGLTLMQAKAKGGGESVGAIQMVLSMITEDFTVISAEGKRAESVPLAPYLPEAPEGWFRKDFSVADAEALVGVTYRESAVMVSTNNNRIGAFVNARNQADGATATYLRGERQVLIAMSKRTDADMRSFRGSIMSALSANVSGISNWDKDDFGTLHGILIRENKRYSETANSSVRQPLNYRSFSAKMGNQVRIEVLTNASDADVVAVLRNLDVIGINNDTLIEPDPALTPGTGLITQAEGLLSTEPPAPTAAYQAYQLLRAGEQLNPTDVRLLQAMVQGDVENWEELYEQYGLVDQFSTRVLKFFGPKPPETAEDRMKRRAIAMLRQQGVWLEHEEDILKRIRGGRLQYQDDIQRYYQSDKFYAEEVLDLLADLPLEPTPEEIAAAEAAVERQLIIRRGIEVKQGESLTDNCKIELGVRRCVLTDELDEG